MSRCVWRTRCQWTGEVGYFYRRNLNIQRPKINYLYVIHPTSQSSTWIGKRSRFDDIFASAVSDWPSEQRFEKSNFRSTPEPLSNIFFGVTLLLHNAIILWWTIASVVFHLPKQLLHWCNQSIHYRHQERPMFDKLLWMWDVILHL
jgi:hypothetical protein